MAECLLRMEHITKKFGVFTANRDISLTLHQGEVLTLLGENGAGKSTLMNVLCGLYHPTEGKIFLHGQEVRLTSPASAVQRGIGMVHQHFMLVEAMTVFQNIILGLASALPALILLAVIVIVVIVLVKNARKKRRAKFAAQQEPPQEPKQ